MNTTHGKRAANKHAHTRSQTSFFSCAGREFNQRGNVSDTTGTRCVYRSVSDAEAGILEAEWMCRTTKSTHTHTHTHIVLYWSRGVCLWCFQGHCAEYRSIEVTSASHTKRSSILPHCCFHRLRFCFISAPAEHRSIILFSLQSSSYSAPRFDPADSWNCIITGFWCASFLLSTPN